MSLRLAWGTQWKPVSKTNQNQIPNLKWEKELETFLKEEKDIQMPQTYGNMLNFTTPQRNINQNHTNTTQVREL